MRRRAPGGGVAEASDGEGGKTPFAGRLAVAPGRQQRGWYRLRFPGFPVAGRQAALRVIPGGGPGDSPWGGLQRGRWTPAAARPEPMTAPGIAGTRIEA